VASDGEHEERKARRVDGAEEVSLRACDDERDAASE
jgi:hypothetical protein